MKKRNSRHDWRKAVLYRVVLCALLLTFGFISLSRINPVQASAPQSDTINPTVGSAVSWIGDAPGAPPAANGESTCQDNPLNTPPTSPGLNCDVFTLNVSGVPADWAGKRVRVRFTWNTIASDYDMVVRKESGTTPGYQADQDTFIIDSGRGQSTLEEAVFSPQDSGTGIYYVRAIYFAGGGAADQYHGTATTFSAVSNAPAASCALPGYDNYQPPVGFPNRDNAGEPSIGVNWNTGNVLFQERLTSVRATFSDSTSPADPVSGVIWYANRVPAERTGLDPILFTDRETGRTIGGELGPDGATNGGISDDDISTFIQTFQTGVTQGFDHQTIGGGPPKPGIPGRQPTTSYPHLFYYASQQNALATVATSFDGGLTYVGAVPAYTLLQCSNLHGHIKVAPDGTVYLPNKSCGSKAAVVVSEDNGLNWSVRPIPTASDGDDDPSVGIGAGGKVYVAYTAVDGHPHVAISDDKGLTWHDDTDLGPLTASFPTAGALRTSVFPAAVAGDNNRAAVFFLATNSADPDNPTGTDGEDTAPGNATDDFAGTWYPFIATTCDGGISWTVVRADNDPLRPGMKNPVQQGVVCKNGTTCPGPPTTVDTRNLLDFNDITVDRKGRILAAYADGCITGDCVSLPDNSTTRTGNNGTATATIIRQRSGMRLFAEFDPASPAAPLLSPPVQIKESKKGNALTWATPDNNGSALTVYRIYRGTVGGKETKIAEVKANVNSYQDRKGKRRGVKYYYHVTAVNAYGESPLGSKVFVSKG